MKCLRCGYCCTKLVTAIVVDPDKGIVDENLKGINLAEERCPHLQGDAVGKYSCAIHDREWYEEIPCSRYQNHSWWDDSVCRMGNFLVNGVG